MNEPTLSDAPSPPGGGRLALVITGVVLWLGVVRVLDAQAPAPPPEPEVVPAETDEEPPESDASSPEDEAPTAPAPAPAQGEGSSSEAPRSDRPELAGLQSPNREGWVLDFEQDLSRLDVLRWSGLAERREGGETRPYVGKITLSFSEAVQEAFPVGADGRVEVVTRSAHRSELVRSGRLLVEFAGHAPREHDYSWLRVAAAPELLASEVGASSSTLTVRNPSIQPLKVRVRAGWKDETGWLQGDGSSPSSALSELELAAGESRELVLSYTPSDSGELSQPLVRSIL